MEKSEKFRTIDDNLLVTQEKYKFPKNLKGLVLNNSNSNSRKHINNMRFSQLITFNNIIKTENLKVRLPKISSEKLLITEADILLKKSKRQKGLAPIRNDKRSKLQKLKEISLKNYIIENLHEKIQEINDKTYEITKKLNDRQNSHDKLCYKYLKTIEQNRRKNDEEKNIIEKIKQLNDEKMEIITKLNSEKSNLEDKIKKNLKFILILQRYAYFINKIFGNELEYKNWNKEKDYQEIMNYYYDKLKDDKVIDCLKKDDGIAIFMRKFTYLQDSIINKLNEINSMKIEEQKTKVENDNFIKYLIKEKDSNNKYNLQLNKLKNENENKIRDFNTDENLTFQYMKNIIEIGQELGIKNKPDLAKMNLIESMYYCDDILKDLRQKEKLIDTKIKSIENIFNLGDQNEKDLIKDIITNQMKLNNNEKFIKEKQKKYEQFNKDKIKLIKKTFKIIIKSRKAGPKYPLITNKSKSKTKSNEQKNNDNNIYDYLYFD